MRAGVYWGMGNARIHTYETILDYYSARNTEPITPKRSELLLRAIEHGVSDDTLETIANATRISTSDTIVLPRHRYENLSRGKGWCRKGKGNNAVWGERVEGGYRVGPGYWSVGGSDGYSRKGDSDWTVTNVTVGPETWTIAV